MLKEIIKLIMWPGNQPGHWSWPKKSDPVIKGVGSWPNISDSIIWVDGSWPKKKLGSWPWPSHDPQHYMKIFYHWNGNSILTVTGENKKFQRSTFCVTLNPNSISHRRLEIFQWTHLSKIAKIFIKGYYHYS